MSPSGLADYRKSVEPIVEQFCVSCHSASTKKGNVVLEAEGDGLNLLLGDRELWQKVLKAMRAGMMPPKGKDHPSAEQMGHIESWIKYSAFAIDPKNPDPGRVTIRRLNRTEYRNTIRDLLGVDFNATAEFPPDDTGHGFDNIGDVLTLSPLLLEKYIAAAKEVIYKAVPIEPRVPVERRIAGRAFATTDAKPVGPLDGPLALPYVKAATATYTHQAEHAGSYRLLLDLTANETFVDGQFDYNKCRLTFKANGKPLLTQEFVRQGGKTYHFEYDQEWTAGPQEFTVEVEPLTPKERQVRNLTLRIQAVTVRGPMAKEHWVRPANHEKFFPGDVPSDVTDRQAYTRKLLASFSSRAFRRPVDAATLDRLVDFVEASAAKSGTSYEATFAKAMVVVLASPRFLFREEVPVANSTDPFPLLDEYSLASRLSYFLWSSMPDDGLLRLAADGKLRQNLSAEVTRMLADRRSSEFVKNFAGQWLQARGIDTVNVNAAAVLAKDEVPDPKAQERRARFRELSRKAPDSLTPDEKKELEAARGAFFGGFRRFAQFELTGDLRRAMRQETELTFEYIVRENRSLLELVDADYTFLNERLARHYGINGVTGDQMRKVTLPPDSPRGGILTQAAVLILTSNPDRTSPVKRGLYILENLLGTPPPPPPPDVATLEESSAAIKGKPPTLRESLKLHRADALCSSCHNRMDPLGLAFENFNALGRWRDKELGQSIESSGELLSGESFKDVRGLKHVLATDRRLDFYRCITEKMLIYALGRGPEYNDTHTVDEIVEKLDDVKGRPSVLISGIVESPAFQRRRK
ncbi:MAG: DUF1592 domain-containing protein [Gemmataceae bacterium]